MSRSRRRVLITVVIVSIISVVVRAGSHRAGSPSVGAYASGVYPNLFTSVLGKSDKEVKAKLAHAFAQLFHGDSASQSIYFPVGTDMAYIEDVLHNDVRTEGMSYGMMIAVQLGKKNEFDRLWTWAKRNMQQHSGPHKNYFAWHCKTDGTKLDENAASDGEEWFVMSLFFASARWGNGPGIYDYNAEAQAILHTMLHKTEEDGGAGTVTNMFDTTEHQVVFVPSADAAGFTDPSYHLPHFYELWARWASHDNGFWCTAARVSRAFLKKAVNPVTGLAPEYSHFDGTPIASWSADSKDFRFDAWRVAMNVAVDHSWFAADPWAVTQSNRLLTFFTSQGITAYFNQFTLDGKSLSTDRSVGLMAMNSVACLAATIPERKAFIREFWDAPVPAGPYRYYDGMLYMLALLQDSGNFKIYDPTHSVIPKCSPSH